MQDALPEARARARRERSRDDAPEPDRRSGGGLRRRDRRRGLARAEGRPARRGRRSRGRRRARTRRDGLRHARALRASRRRRRRVSTRSSPRVSPGSSPASSIPTPAHGGGLEQLRAAGVEVELADGELAFRCRQQVEEWRTWVTKGRPFVTYKVALTLDGRVRMPGERWVTGEASRKLVHVLRAQSDAVAVGMGTVRWDNPRLDARDVPVVRQPRRIAFGRGPLPDDSELELRSGPLREELEALAADGVQSLLLEGGPTLAAAFLEADLVDKLARLRRAAALRRGAGHARGASAPARARPYGGATDRRGRSAAGVRPRAVGTVRGVFTGIVRELGVVIAAEEAGGGRALTVQAPETARAHDRRRLGCGQRLLPDGGDDRGGARSRSTPSRRRSRARRSAPSKRAAESTSSRHCAPETSSVVTTCKGTSTGSAASSRSRRKARGSASSSPLPTTSCATAWRRARSRSTASR